MVYYGVVAPGISTVYEDFSYVERVSKLYPYPKFRKFYTKEKAWEFVRKYKYKSNNLTIHCYGDVFPELCVRMEYFVKDKLYYNFHTKSVGRIRVTPKENVDMFQTDERISAMIDKQLDDMSILDHLLAIQEGLNILGPYLEVEICVPDYSIYYTIMQYNGNNNVIKTLRRKLFNRLGGIAVTLERRSHEIRRSDERRSFYDGRSFYDYTDD